MNLIEKLLSERQIDYIGSESFIKQQYDEEKIMNQVDIICNFHKSMQNIDGEYLIALQSNIGKKIQKLKVQEKRNYRYFEEVRRKGANDLFDMILVKCCGPMFEKAEKILAHFDDNNFYMKLIYRSMKNNEVCLGDTSLENLYFDNCLCINSIKKMSLDMIEWDIINLVTKCRRKNIKYDEHKVIDKFLQNESLDDTSFEFINLILDYPSDFMKLCERKREKRKEYSIEYYTKRLNNYIKRRDFK